MSRKKIIESEDIKRIHVYIYLSQEEEAILRVRAALNSNTLPEYITHIIKDHITEQQKNLVKDFLKTVK